MLANEQRNSVEESKIWYNAVNVLGSMLYGILQLQLVERHTMVAGSSRPSRVRQMASQEISLVCLVVSLVLVFCGLKTHLQICCLTSLQCQPSYR